MNPKKKCFGKLFSRFYRGIEKDSHNKSFGKPVFSCELFRLSKYLMFSGFPVTFLYVQFSFHIVQKDVEHLNGWYEHIPGEFVKTDKRQYPIVNNRN